MKSSLGMIRSKHGPARNRQQRLGGRITPCAMGPQNHGKIKQQKYLVLTPYGTKAVIPVKIEMSSLKCSMVDKNKNYEGLLLNLDLMDKKRELAAIAEEKHKRKMDGYYNSKVRYTVLRPGDLVYRNNEANKKEDTENLGPK
ncbi:hypothetical protein Tco_0309672 [Tanacetum coccineum]